MMKYPNTVVSEATGMIICYQALYVDGACRKDLSVGTMTCTMSGTQVQQSEVYGQSIHIMETLLTSVDFSSA